MPKILLKTDDPLKVIKKIYNMCNPVGMGIFQYTPTPLTDEEAAGYIHEDHIYMDYAKGRQCKFNGKIVEGGVEIDAVFWYDHTQEDINNLVLLFS